MLTLLLTLLLALAGPLAVGSVATQPSGGDRTAQVGRHGDQDVVASTRLASSRVRTAAPRAELDLGAAVLPTVRAPSRHLRTHSVAGARTAPARSAPAGGTLSRAPPA